MVSCNNEICNDSCTALDLSASKGVLRAMYSGVLASNTIVNILNNEIEENMGYLLYNEMMKT
jgi:hypothetical protein